MKIAFCGCSWVSSVNRSHRYYDRMWQNIVAKKLKISVDTGKGYRALANVNEHGGQEVPHLHFHLFGGERVGKMVE